QLPVLPRPLGVPNPPTSRPKTWGEKRAELLDEDRHKAKRKALIKEASQGYFHDYNRARSANGGKLWTAPPVLIREDMAQYFPDIQGKALTGETVHTTDLLLGKVTLLAILSTRLSEEHVSSFCQPVLDDWSTSPLFSHVQINHQDNLLKSLLLNFLVSSLKRTVPENRWGTYMISGGEWSSYDMTSPLGIENKLLGYVYLIDPNAKIRWAGNAMASEEEVDNLRRATAVLMRRLVKE
ncbi:hypothetical protein TREMEDRAFT_17176, partial [Tremella mesenterica DSM 1558]|uniref:uncharacterized protein n=1 Tax=Tremella mesenterica (strain ATCC 24925 / CBS 8224 / DSM 1558 / NBRC 9311 / NRRL Y-6157 / RJB 2259-6 / UBC 559-6) TaxID=578456 RepID=UPI0003F4A2EF